MARPQKKGFDYFPLDTDFIDNSKVRLIVREFKSAGISTIIAVFSMLYKQNGYYIDWNEDFIVMVAEKINEDMELVEKIIDKCIQKSLFDKAMFDEYKILTSEAIQATFLEVVERRKDTLVDTRYALSDVKALINHTKTELSPTLTPNFAYISTQRESKVKETESKVKETESKKGLFSETPDENISGSGVTFEMVKNEFEGSGQWKENMFRSFSDEKDFDAKFLSAAIKKYLKEFHTLLEINKYKTISDVKRHFFNSLKYKFDNKKSKPNGIHSITGENGQTIVEADIDFSQIGKD